MQKVQALIPTDTVNMCDMALILRQLGRHKESVELLNKALESNPTSVKFLMELAVSKILGVYELIRVGFRFTNYTIIHIQ